MIDIQTMLIIIAIALSLVAGAVKIGHMIAARYIKEHMPSLHADLLNIKKN